MAAGQVVLCFPPLSETDPLFGKKKELLCSRHTGLEFQWNFSLNVEEHLQTLDRMVQSARILHLEETELYFVGDDESGPFSTKNELEALNSVLSMINSSLSGPEDCKANVLKILQEATIRMISSIGATSVDEMAVDHTNSGAEESLLKWAVNHGVNTKLKISHFKGAGRGAVASEDINIGDTALEVPESLIISEDVVYESEMFDILKKFEGIDTDTMLLLWSMKERYNLSSKFKLYFETLPGEFNTGLRLGIDALAALEGTLLFEEILQAREHLRKQYDALCPVLYTDYPEVFRPELYTWDHFLWACELWYSNSMKIILTGGKLKTCLVPVAGFLNHSLCPHIMHYGRVDPTTKSLKFNVSRPCKGGDQCFLSYGSYPSSHLITFYGFMPKGDNPYDVIPLDFDAPDDGSNQSPPSRTGWTTHMVRGTWLSRSNVPPTYGLPSPLLAHLHAVLEDSDAEPTAETNKDQERAVFETIQSIFDPMMEALGETDEHDRENSSWDVKLALQYKDPQRRIISSILSSCSKGLDMLDCLQSENPPVGPNM